MSKLLKLISIIASILNSVYLIWLILNITNFIGWLVLLADLIYVISFDLFLINHWNQNSKKRSYRKPRGTLDVFLPIVNEPYEMFEETLKAAVNIKYDQKTVYVLDDGNRTDIKFLADKYGARYIARKSSEHYKAGNLNSALSKSNGEYILVLDADQVVLPSIAEHLLGHFIKDSKMAIVTTRQRYKISKNDFNNDYIFYMHMQRGKNINNAAISTGTGVIYRRSAIDAIKGFQTWNIVEDMYTSYVLHKSGYNSLYIDKPYTTGTAPFDLQTIYKQRGTWATDTFRMFFKQNPMIAKGLTVSQRLHYFEMGFGYIMPAIAVPITFAIMPISLLLHQDLTKSTSIYSSLGLPAFLLIMYVIYSLSNSTTSGIRFWMAMFPVYFKSMVLGIQRKKIRYIVTSKTSGNTRSIKLVIPQIIAVISNFIVITYQLFDGLDITDISNTAWFIVMAYCLYPVITRGLQIQLSLDNITLRFKTLRKFKYSYAS